MIADLNPRDLLANLFDNSRKFMPRNHRIVAHIFPFQNMNIRAADSACHDLNQNFILPRSSPALPERKGTFAQEIEVVEKQLIVEALEKAKGNKSEAARMLGLKWGTFYSKLKKFKIA